MKQTPEPWQQLLFDELSQELSLQQQKQKRLQQGESAPVWLLAYSGGLDSSVLLHCLSQFIKSLALEQQPQLRAVHVQHNLSLHSASWAEFCKQQCAALNIEFISHSIQLDETHELSEVIKNTTAEQPAHISNLEAKARDARYTVFEKNLPTNGLLFLAQHQDDQAETFLYRALRGSGSRGLAAMPKRRALGAGHLLRPFLMLNRQQLEAYAKRQQLQWVEDESNQDVRFDRNFIRQQLMPIIQQRWPQAANTLSRSAALAGESEQLQQDLAELDLAKLDASRQWRAISIAITPLLALAPYRQANVLRYCCLQQQLPMPQHQHIHTILNALADIDQSANTLDDVVTNALKALSVQWSGGFFQQSFGRLYCSAELPNGINKVPLQIELNQSETYSVETALGRLSLCLSNGEQQSLIISYRQGGERLLWADGQHRTLKNKWQEWQVPPWWRGYYPLVLQGNTVVAIPGFYTHPDWRALITQLDFSDV